MLWLNPCTMKLYALVVVGMGFLFFISCVQSEQIIPQVADEAPLRRLTTEQYNNTLRDLFADVELPPFQFSEVRITGFYDNNTSINTASSITVENYQQAAFFITTAMDEQHYFPECGDDDCLQGFLLTQAELLWRRTVLEEEKNELVFVIQEWREELDRALVMRMGMQYLLQSPQFLYFPEVGLPEQEKNGMIPLQDEEIANRLSYLLWNTVPDDVLREQARKGELHTREQISQQAWRMLADQKSNEGMLQFFVQWLQLEQIGSATIDFDQIWLMDEENQEIISAFLHQQLQPEMRQEIEIFLLHHLFEQEGTLAELLTSTESFVSPNLASLYDVEIPDGAQSFVWKTKKSALSSTLELDELFFQSSYFPIVFPSNERSGLLTRVGLLHKKTKPSHPSPVQRGVFVMEQFLCLAPNPPPEDVPPLEEVEGEEPQTNRDRYVQHTTNPACYECHKMMDGIGFSFENYDPLGRYRTTENGVPIDSTGELMGADVAGDLENAIHLSEKLSQSRTVHDCVTQHWFEYSMGRKDWREEDYELLKYLREGFWSSGGNIPELIVNVVSSPAYRFISVEEE